MRSYTNIECLGRVATIGVPTLGVDFVTSAQMHSRVTRMLNKTVSAASRRLASHRLASFLQLIFQTNHMLACINMAFLKGVETIGVSTLGVYFGTYS